MKKRNNDDTEGSSMSNYPLRIVFLAVTTCLASCTNGFSIHVDSARGVLTFYESGVLRSTKLSPCLTEVILYENAKPPAVLWKIRAKRGCVKVSSLKVGRDYAGFVEDVPFGKNVAGAEVYAEAREQPPDEPGRWGKSDLWNLR
jgi:hypothetical protein